MRYSLCNNSFNSWRSSRIISHVLKWPKGGIGERTGIIPKVRYEQYHVFYDQKSEKKEGNKRDG